MSSTILNSTAPAASASGESVESLGDLAHALALERQELRATRADAGRLERNRVALARAHRELSHALIARHLPSPATA